MDLSVQKMQPPATVRGKSAARKTDQASSDEAVGDVARDELVRFKHGNTGYDKIDPDEQKDRSDNNDDRSGRRKNRQMLSHEGLSELTSSVELLQTEQVSADGRMNLRAYQTTTAKDEEEVGPHLEINI